MKLFTRALALAVLTASVLIMSSPVRADGPRARFSDVASYMGQPQLPVTLSLVVAGGGPGKFSTVNLMKLLAGDKFSAEVGKLQGQYGKADVNSFLSVFDFVVDDALKIAAEKHVALPTVPNPNPNDGKALAGALYKLGETNGSFDVEYMLDGLVSHGIHVQVMDDIDHKFGRPADSNYHKVLQTAMTDLKGVYGL